MPGQAGARPNKMPAAPSLDSLPGAEKRGGAEVKMSNMVTFSLPGSWSGANSDDAAELSRSALRLSLLNEEPGPRWLKRCARGLSTTHPGSSTPSCRRRGGAGRLTYGELDRRARGAGRRGLRALGARRGSGRCCSTRRGSTSSPPSSAACTPGWWRCPPTRRARTRHAAAAAGDRRATPAPRVGADHRGGLPAAAARRSPARIPELAGAALAGRPTTWTRGRREEWRDPRRRPGRRSPSSSTPRARPRRPRA